MTDNKSTILEIRIIFTPAADVDNDYDQLSRVSQVRKKEFKQMKKLLKAFKCVMSITQYAI